MSSKAKAEEGVLLTKKSYPQKNADYGGGRRDTPTLQRLQKDLAHVHAGLVAKERSQFESLSCVPCSNTAKTSEVYERIKDFTDEEMASHFRNNASRPGSAQRWTTSGMIGFMCGILAFCLKQTIASILYLRETMLDAIMDTDGDTSLMETGFRSAWLWQTYVILIIFTSSLVVLSSAVILYGEPRAAGSGIPETSAFLNGVIIPKTFTISVVIAKFASCALAVGSGIPAGPEGPMIHMGSVLGSLVSQGVFMPKFMKNFLKPFHNVCDRRDFMGAGVAGGVAAAFSAPIGGLLFVAEEIATHWDVDLGMQIFFCAIVACSTVEVLMSSFTTFIYIGGLGAIKEKSAILFAVNKEISVNVIMFIPTIILGVIGGLSGVVFNRISVGASAFRAKHIKPRKILFLLEPVLVAIVYCSAIIFIPTFFDCVPIDCSQDPESAACARVGLSGLDDESVIGYGCPADTYNPAATLYLTSGEEAVKHLYWRGSHYQFDYLPLLMMLVVYLPVSAYANGLSCSTGIVVPCLLNGALIGRIFGLLVTDICGISPDDPYTEWIDPGAFALIGSAAFFSGVARITMALTVIITEISDDSNFILPIMISIVIAKWTADSTGNHPIYHALQGLKGLPVLASNPHTHAPLESFSAIQVATEQVITMPLEISVRKLAEILRTTKHNAYPCTMSSENGEIFVGLIRREHLIGLIQKEDAWYRKDNKAKARWHNISKYVTGKKLRGDQLAAQELLAFDSPEMLQNETENGMLIFKSVSGTNEKYFIDLKPYVDLSSHTVSEGFSLKATYVLFTSMGLRHLVIVDVFNRVRGIITRHDLLEENLNMCLHRGTMVHPAGRFDQLIRKTDKKCEINESLQTRINPAEKFHEMVEQKRRDDEEEIHSSIQRKYQDN